MSENRKGCLVLENYKIPQKSLEENKLLTKKG